MKQNARAIQVVYKCFREMISHSIALARRMDTGTRAEHIASSRLIIVIQWRL